MSFHATLNVLFVMLFVISQAEVSAAAKNKKHDYERDILLDKELLGVSLKNQAGGPKVAADDLPGRTVLFVFSGSGDAKWNEFLVRMVNQYVNAAPPGGLLTIFVLPEKKTETKWWSDAKGSPFVSFFNEENFSMPGFGYAGLPRFVLFDGDGKMIGDICHDGRDLSGNSVHTYDGTRFTPDSIRKSVEALSGSVSKAATYTDCAEDMRKLVEATTTSGPLLPVLTGLRNKAKDGKGAARVEAAALLEGFRDYLDHQFALISKNVSVNPVLCSRALKRVLAQLAGDKEFGARFEKLQDQMKTDKAFQEELRAAELLWMIRTDAAAIKWGLMDPDLPQRPREKVQAIKKGLDELVARYPRARVTVTATELKNAFGRWAAKAIDPTPW